MAFLLQDQSLFILNKNYLIILCKFNYSYFLQNYNLYIIFFTIGSSLFANSFLFGFWSYLILYFSLIFLTLSTIYQVTNLVLQIIQLISLSAIWILLIINFILVFYFKKQEDIRNIKKLVYANYTNQRLKTILRNSNETTKENSKNINSKSRVVNSIKIAKISDNSSNLIFNKEMLSTPSNDRLQKKTVKQNTENNNLKKNICYRILDNIIDIFFFNVLLYRKE